MIKSKFVLLLITSLTLRSCPKNDKHIESEKTIVFYYNLAGKTWYLIDTDGGDINLKSIPSDSKQLHFHTIEYENSNHNIGSYEIEYSTGDIDVYLNENDEKPIDSYRTTLFREK